MCGRNLLQGQQHEIPGSTEMIRWIGKDVLHFRVRDPLLLVAHVVDQEIVSYFCENRTEVWLSLARLDSNDTLPCKEWAFGAAPYMSHSLPERTSPRRATSITAGWMASQICDGRLPILITRSTWTIGTGNIVPDASVGRTDFQVMFIAGCHSISGRQESSMQCGYRRSGRAERIEDSGIHSHP